MVVTGCTWQPCVSETQTLHTLSNWSLVMDDEQIIYIYIFNCRCWMWKNHKPHRLSFAELTALQDGRLGHQKQSADAKKQRTSQTIAHSKMSSKYDNDSATQAICYLLHKCIRCPSYKGWERPGQQAIKSLLHVNEWDSWLKVQNLPLQRYLPNAIPHAVTGKFISNAAAIIILINCDILFAAGFPFPSSCSCIFHLGQKVLLCSCLFVHKAITWKWKRHRALMLNQQRKGVN